LARFKGNNTRRPLLFSACEATVVLSMPTSHQSGLRQSLTDILFRNGMARPTGFYFISGFLAEKKSNAFTCAF
jgi:hypothetical protein